MSGQAAFDKPARPAALCRGVTTESEKAGWSEEGELNGVVEERDRMSDEEGNGNEIDGEEELAAPDRRERARDPETSRPKRERLVRALYDGKRLYPSSHHETEE